MSMTKQAASAGWLERDRLADDFEGNTLATDDPNFRVYIGSGVLVPTLAVYAVCDDDTVDVIWISVHSE
jgi:hypothetical protein